MLTLLLKSLYYFLPAYAANMAPVLFKFLPFGSKSVNKKLFGKNKTWRGLIVGIIFGTLIFGLQKVLYMKGTFTEISLIDYSGYGLLLGFLLSFGALCGDLVESYYKRKQGIAPGEKWFPWDQLDFVIGALLLSSLVYQVSGEVLLILVLVSPVLHLIVNYLGYLLKLKKNKF